MRLSIPLFVALAASSVANPVAGMNKRDLASTILAAIESAVESAASCAAGEVSYLYTRVLIQLLTS
jgi:hypothetical protein